MSGLSILSCPKCGAEAPPTPPGQAYTCGYCGTVATAKAARAPATPTVGAQPHGGQLPLMLGCGAVLVATLAIVVVLFSSAAPAPTSSSTVASTPGSESAATEAPVAEAQAATPVEAPAPPPPAVTRSLRSSMYEDLDGDGTVDVIAYVERVEGTDSSERFAVFDGATGALRVETPPIALGRQPMAARVGTRVVVAGDRGQLEAYDLGSGDKQWSSTLGDRALAFCGAGRDDAVRVSTADQRMIEVDLVTGRQSDVHAGCDRPLARAPSEQHDPNDRLDHQAPAGVEAYRCGSTRVMGSSSFTVPDACQRRGHVDSSHLDGMVGHRIWKHGRGWLVFGVRAPGAYVPMVGLLMGRSFQWKAEVPATNPLDATQGGPSHAALVGDAVVVSYVTGRDQAHWLTAFAVEDGRRRWAVATEGAPHGLTGRGEALFAHVGTRVLRLDPASGATQLTFGD